MGGRNASLSLCFLLLLIGVSVTQSSFANGEAENVSEAWEVIAQSVVHAQGVEGLTAEVNLSVAVSASGEKTDE